MKFSVPIKFGSRVITIEDEAEDLRDMFRKMDMYDSLPDAGPSGEDDLKFCHRVVKNSKGQPCTYYSIVCESAGQEFKFGILADGSGLFPKGWEPIQRGAYRERHEEAEGELDAPTGDAPKTDDLDRLAMRLVEQGAVKKEGKAYAVASGNARHTVSRNQAGAVECSCRRFGDVRKFNKDFECEHIRAVRLATQGASKAA